MINGGDGDYPDCSPAPQEVVLTVNGTMRNHGRTLILEVGRSWQYARRQGPIATPNDAARFMRGRSMPLGSRAPSVTSSAAGKRGCIAQASASLSLCAAVIW